MMHKLASLLLVSTIFSGCNSKPVEEMATVSYRIDSDRVTVSGLSSGAYMAGQLHVAHSALFGGVAMLAGGPYWCAEASLTKGLGPCVKGGDVSQERLLAYAREMAAAGKVDALANLSDDSVWIFHGANDVAVSADVATAAATFYAELIPQAAITLVADVPAVHGMPTISTGAPCDAMATPYLNACGYDAAGELLKSLYGALTERVSASSELRSIPQPGADDAEMLESAFLYVPERCAAGESCGLHVALHGCQQSAEFVGDAFAAGAGYNEWAEANNLLVLYPQVASSKLAPLNPLGCWDWWGYTSADYATKAGPQIAVIKNMIDTLAATKSQGSP